MNPYEPHDLIASCERTLEVWDRKSQEEKVALLKKFGLLDENGNTHPDYDWTPERYAREFGRSAQAAK